MRNVVDRAIQLNTVPEEHSTDQNQTSISLQKIATKVDTIYKEIDKKNQRGDQIAYLLEKRLGGIKNVIAKKAHESVDIIAKNKNKEAVGSQRKNGRMLEILTWRRKLIW